MSKKLMINKQSDEIVLCENYTPTNIPIYLYKDKKIDWDNYELYINLNIEGNTFQDWTSALVISNYEDIRTWATPNDTTAKLHIYYTREKIRIQPVYRNTTIVYDNFLRNYNTQNLEIVINKNGIYIENQIIRFFSINNHVYTAVMNLIKTSDINNIGIVNLGCIYNKISIRKFIER